MLAHSIVEITCLWLCTLLLSIGDANALYISTLLYCPLDGSIMIIHVLLVCVCSMHYATTSQEMIVCSFRTRMMFINHNLGYRIWPSLAQHSITQVMIYNLGYDL